MSLETHPAERIQGLMPLATCINECGRMTMQYHHLYLDPLPVFFCPVSSHFRESGKQVYFLGPLSVWSTWLSSSTWDPAPGCELLLWVAV